MYDLMRGARYPCDLYDDIYACLLPNNMVFSKYRIITHAAIVDTKI